MDRKLLIDLRLKIRALPTSILSGFRTKATWWLIRATYTISIGLQSGWVTRAGSPPRWTSRRPLRKRVVVALSWSGSRRYFLESVGSGFLVEHLICLYSHLAWVWFLIWFLASVFRQQDAKGSLNSQQRKLTIRRSFGGGALAIRPRQTQTEQSWAKIDGVPLQEGEKENPSCWREVILLAWSLICILFSLQTLRPSQSEAFSRVLRSRRNLSKGIH